jgi:sulfate adenylyltransferase subunit 1
VTLLLDDDLDVSRGDMIASVDAPPAVGDELTATLCWLSERPLRRGARVLIKHGTRTVAATVDDLRVRLDEQTLRLVGSPDRLDLNDIGGVRIRTARPIPVDDYRRSRSTGSFIVVDPSDGATVAAGLIGTALPVAPAQP